MDLNFSKRRSIQKEKKGKSGIMTKKRVTVAFFVRANR